VWYVFYDIHTLAHFFGYWFKFLIIRETSTCFLIGLMFEVFEQIFKHWIPNFNECWWDYLILDILICNSLGTFMGYLTVEVANIQFLSWARKHEPVLRQRKWEMYKSVPRYISLVSISLFVCCVDLMNFFLKFIFWIPANHKLLQIRVLIWTMSGIAATHEYYEYVTNRNCKRLGSHFFTAIFSLAIELSIPLKFGRGKFPTHFSGFRSANSRIRGLHNAFSSFVIGNRASKVVAQLLPRATVN